MKLIVFIKSGVKRGQIKEKKNEKEKREKRHAMKQSWLWGAYVSCIQPKDYKFPVSFACFSAFSAGRLGGYPPWTTVLQRAVHLCRQRFLRNTNLRTYLDLRLMSALASPSAAMHARPHDGANSSRATATGRPPSAQSAHTARGFRSPTEAPLVSCQGLISGTRRPSHSSREREFCGATLVLLGESSYDVVLSVKGYDVHFTVSGRQN